jgi:hypothetical protein
MSVKPVRIQLKRSKGFNLQAVSQAINGLECVNVARPSRWGNPFVIGKDGDAAECVRKYAEMLTPYRHHGENSGLDKFLISTASLEDIQTALRGKNLACWCAASPCHADVLLSIANEEPIE